MKKKLRNVALVSITACIPLLAQASILIDSTNIDKQINSKNTGTVTIKVCAPYPLCVEEIQSSQVKDKQEKTKKKTK
jgi:hypothetical protein